MTTIHRITPGCAIPIPCWMWDSHFQCWWRKECIPNTVIDLYTHWHTDQPTPPTAVPDPTDKGGRT